MKFLSSTCFEHHVFIIRKTICTCSFFLWYVFLALCKQSSGWKNVIDTKVLKAVVSERFVGSHYIIVFIYVHHHYHPSLVRL
jgi:hypothetical protein